MDSNVGIYRDFTKTIYLRCGAMLPQKVFKIRILKLAENGFHTKNRLFLDFWTLVANSQTFQTNSLTFGGCISNSLTFLRFQVGGHPGPVYTALLRYSSLKTNLDNCSSWKKNDINLTILESLDLHTGNCADNLS